MTTYLDSAGEFGAQIRAQRKRRGWSIQRAEDKTGIKGVVLGSYERGDRIPPLSQAIGVAEAYGLRLAVIGPEDVVVRGTGEDSRVEWVIVYGPNKDGLIECDSREEAERIWECMPDSRIAFRTHVFGELTFAGES